MKRILCSLSASNDQLTIFNIPNMYNKLIRGPMLWSQFSAIFTHFRLKKLAFFSKNRCYDHNFCKNYLCFASKTPIFSLNFSAKIFLKSSHRSPDGGFNKNTCLRVQFIERADVRHNFLLQIPERNPECASGTLPCQRGSSSGIKLIKAKSVPGVDVMITIFRDFRHFLAKKLAFFSKTNVLIKFLQNLALFWVKNANFLLIFSAKIFKKS
jgi:hypothetical protein